MPRSNRAFWVAGLLVALAIDLLFWQQYPGISFTAWVLIALAAGLYLAFREGVRPAPLSYALIGLILVLAFLPAVRNEPLTRFLSIAGSLFGLLLLAATLRGGQWLKYRLADYVVAFSFLNVAAITRPAARPVQTETDTETEIQKPAAGWRGVLPYLRGVLIALPVLFILGGLLASADPLFARYLENIFDWFSIERLPEYIFRLFYVVVLGYLFTGVLLHAVWPKHEVQPAYRQGWLKPFLGWTEAAIVLISVNLLFLFFVILQFRYLFGGESNIVATGFTYAEYARRGFGELVFVAVLSLALYLVMYYVTRREKLTRQRIFTVLVVLLLSLVLVILASSLQRVLLYQDAYGFTRLRSYTIFFIPWLAALLLAAIGLQLARRSERFATALLLFGFGFVLTLGLANVDGWIVHQNVDRVRQGAEELDVPYLVSLSDDSVPAIVSEMNQSGTPEGLQQQLKAALACRINIEADRQTVTDWRSYNLSTARADRLLNEQQSGLEAYPVTDADSIPYLYVTLPGGEEVDCYNYQAWVD